MEKKVKKEVTPAEKKSVLTTFVLLFPSLMICVLVTRDPSFFNSLFAMGLFCYQAITLKSFVDDHYALG